MQEDMRLVKLQEEYTGTIAWPETHFWNVQFLAGLQGKMPLPTNNIKNALF
jgi:hypothetical protein